MSGKKQEKLFAIVWSWSIGGWCFTTLESAIAEARKQCKTMNCGEIQIAKKIDEDDNYEIVYREKFENPNR